MTARPAIAVAAALLAVAHAAWPCSLVSNALRPSNYDLVKAAHAIVLARAERFAAASAGQLVGGRVTFAAVDVLKGKVAPGRVEIHGVEAETRSDQGTFAGPRPTTTDGMCNAYDFQAGHLYVLFLAQGADGWGLHRLPGSRVSEEVEDADSPWVHAVRAYVKVAALDNPVRERAALLALAARAGSLEDSRRYPLALEEDVERHFRTPYPSRSLDDLRAMWAVNRRPSVPYTHAWGNEASYRARILYAIGAGKHVAAIPFLRDVIVGKEPSRDMRPYDGTDEDLKPIARAVLAGLGASP